jgi:hypothetical protein
MSKEAHVPIRTCVGCRQRKKKEEMIWMIQRPERVTVVDPKKPHQGRGLYLCPDDECLTMAKKRNRGIAFLETKDFRRPSVKGSFTQEVGNGKK